MSLPAPDAYQYDTAGVLLKKKCSGCKIPKISDEFYPHPSNKHGLSNQCKTCQRDRLFRKIYGITVEDYERMFLEQNGLCSICGSPESRLTKGKGRRLHVDHCHDTGKIRGLLCGACNTAIGSLQHDVSILQKAIDYLNRI